MPICPNCKTRWQGDEDLRPCNCADPRDFLEGLRKQKEEVIEAAILLRDEYAKVSHEEKLVALRTIPHVMDAVRTVLNELDTLEDMQAFHERD